jgi:hypothetical protein
LVRSEALDLNGAVSCACGGCYVAGVVVFVIAMVWLVITAAAGVVVDIVLRRRDRAARRGGHYLFPLCANCGYNVHALPGSRCPECGSQLRAVWLEWKKK